MLFRSHGKVENIRERVRQRQRETDREPLSLSLHPVNEETDIEY